MVLALHTENLGKEGTKGWSHFIHYAQEAVNLRVFKWRNWEVGVGGNEISSGRTV